MIDTVQRLGIDYYFQDEIEQILQRQYIIFFTHGGDRHNDLQEVALRFRLLRQQGYHVSPGLCVRVCIFFCQLFVI